MADKTEPDASFFSGKPVLSIETATPVCSVALRLPDGTIRERSEEGKGVHSEQTFVFVDALLAGANLSVAELGAIIVSAGPGSYTGLRVASSAVKGLLFGTEVPLYACHTLGGIALGALAALQTDAHYYNRSAPCAPLSGVSGPVKAVQVAQKRMHATGCEAVIDARRNHLYHQSWVFRDGSVVPDSEVAVRELGEVLDVCKDRSIVAGTGLERLRKPGKGSPKSLWMTSATPLGDIVSARHILAAAGLPDAAQREHLIKKVAPEHFEPYYCSGL